MKYGREIKREIKFMIIFKIQISATERSESPATRHVFHPEWQPARFLLPSRTRSSRPTGPQGQTSFHVSYNILKLAHFVYPIFSEKKDNFYFMSCILY